MELRVKNLTVSFGKKEVLQNASFSVTPGSYGVVGENGAGKTTLFRSVLGLQRYRGEIDRIGIRHMGYVPQRFDGLPGLNLTCTLLYFACLHGVPKEEQKSLAAALLEQVNLTDEKEKKVRELSGGMLRRLGIAQALIGEPELLIMDEPTVGLDPAERIRLREVLRRIRGERILLISSHEIRELEHLCDTILFLHRGKVVEAESVERLRERFGTEDLEEIYFRMTGGNG